MGESGRSIQVTDTVRVRRKKKKKQRASGVDTAKRVAFVARMLARGHYKHEIKKACYKKYDVKARAVETYLRLAKNIIRAALDESVEDLRAQSLATYRGVIKSKRATRRDIILAQKRIDKITGVEITQPLQIELPQEENDELAKLTDILERTPGALEKFLNEDAQPNAGSNGNGTCKTKGTVTRPHVTRAHDADGDTG